MKKRSPKAIIHINRNILQQNHKHDTKYPVCRVEVQGNTYYGSRVDIWGPSSMVYSPDKPRKCGAKLWIETDSELYIHDQTTYKDMKHQHTKGYMDHMAKVNKGQEYKYPSMGKGKPIDKDKFLNTKKSL